MEMGSVQHGAARARMRADVDDQLRDLYHVDERPLLPAIAEHRNRLPGERLPRERRQHHSIGPNLSGAGGVEWANDGDVEPILGAQRKRIRFAERLRLPVRPSKGRRHAVGSRGIFREVAAFDVSVHF
jgi:hypothetical protein